MTPRQRECLTFIEGFWAEHGYSPSHDEIAKGIGSCQRGHVTNRLTTGLAEQGLITLQYHKKRSIRLTGKCPCCGRG